MRWQEFMVYINYFINKDWKIKWFKVNQGSIVLQHYTRDDLIKWRECSEQPVEMDDKHRQVPLTYICTAIVTVVCLDN